ALSTTRASFPALQALFAANGLALTRRAWLRSEIEQLAQGKLDLSTAHGLQWAPLSERAMGLSPKEFWALVATKCPRTVHSRAHGATCGPRSCRYFTGVATRGELTMWSAELRSQAVGTSYSTARRR